MVAISYNKNMKKVTYRKAALKMLRRMPPKTAERIIGKIESYADDPGSQANNVKALVGVDAVRLRVGDWRVIMHDGVVLDVLNIAARGSAY